MTMMDRVFASGALLLFGAYLLVIVVHVPRFGLAAVCVIGFAMAAIDFGLLLSRRRRMNRRSERAASFQRRPASD